MSETTMQRMERSAEDLKRILKKREAVYAEAMKVPACREVIGDLVFEVACALETMPFAMTEFDQGKRHVGLEVLDRCANAAPSETIKMLTERGFR